MFVNDAVPLLLFHDFYNNNKGTAKIVVEQLGWDLGLPIPKSRLAKNRVPVVKEHPTPLWTSRRVIARRRDEYGVVLEGEWSVRPGEGDWNVFVAGQSWHNPAGMVHQGMNRTSGTVTAMFTFVVDKNSRW